MSAELASVQAGALDVGIVHDWFPGIAGGERVVEQMVQAFPQSKVYSLFDFLTEAERQEIVGSRTIEVSRLNRLPGVKKYYRYLLNQCTRAIEEFDVTHHDVVLTSSAALAKGVLTAPGQPHVAYIHSPARYAWDLTHEYINGLDGRFGALKRHMAHRMMHKFRLWDMRTPPSIDLMLANSKFIAQRIRKVYGRDSLVVYPPVKTDDFTLGTAPKEEFYLTASRMVPYKRIDMIAAAFAGMPDKKLVIIGDGPEMHRVKAAAGPNVEILGYQSFDVLRDHMQRAKAFIFAAQEDFGIIPVEAQACGTPVIALGQGGTAETVKALDHADKPTGVWFQKQEVADLQDAVKRFEAAQDKFDMDTCRENALFFGAARFRQQLQELVLRGNEIGYDALLRDTRGQ
ncbi:glycosyltransferase [Pseudooceanicola sp. CBS1P-1]|uniref:Glycosyltransferase n=2 Tax=Paracoccaceae TaxID=31989 RepID=A0A6L7G991_9RHOB|nr:glycosyltransferase [Pseudooceanicola endophyticus]MXN20774.1 glycosyltransferase [Pseudooceanicola albus]